MKAEWNFLRTLSKMCSKETSTKGKRLYRTDFDAIFRQVTVSIGSENQPVLKIKTRIISEIYKNDLPALFFAFVYRRSPQIVTVTHQYHHCVCGKLLRNRTRRQTHCGFLRADVAL